MRVYERLCIYYVKKRCVSTHNVTETVRCSSCVCMWTGTIYTRNNVRDIWVKTGGQKWTVAKEQIPFSRRCVRASIIAVANKLNPMWRRGEERRKRALCLPPAETSVFISAHGSGQDKCRPFSPAASAEQAHAARRSAALLAWLGVFRWNAKKNLRWNLTNLKY